MAIRKNAGAKIHPYLTHKVVCIRCNRKFPTCTRAFVLQHSLRADDISVLFLAMTHEGALLLAADQSPMLRCFA